MHLKKSLPLIGGTCHGKSVEVDENALAIEVDIHTTAEPIGDPFFTEIYTRRKFSGEEFGEAYECFVSPKDDEIEALELARWTVTRNGNANGSSNESEDEGARVARPLDLGTISDEIGKLSRRFQLKLKEDSSPDPEDFERMRDLSDVLKRLSDEERTVSVRSLEDVSLVGPRDDVSDQPEDKSTPSGSAQSASSLVPNLDNREMNL